METRKKYLQLLAKSPGLFLKKTKVGGWSYAASYPDLLECHCTDKLNRTKINYREELDLNLLRHVQATASQEPIHLLDVGPGFLFSTAVRIAKLAQAGLAEVHLHLVDPLFHEEKHNKKVAAENEQEVVMLEMTQHAFPDFFRLMRDCGINCVPSNSSLLLESCPQSSDISKQSEDNLSNTDASKQMKVYVYVYSDLQQIPDSFVKQFAAVTAIDVWPPVTQEKLLGNFIPQLSEGCLVLSCLQSPPSKEEFSSSLTEEIIALSPDKSSENQKRIKESWLTFVENFYQATGQADFTQVETTLKNLKFTKELNEILLEAAYHPAIPHQMRQVLVKHQHDSKEQKSVNSQVGFFSANSNLMTTKPTGDPSPSSDITPPSQLPK